MATSPDSVASDESLGESWVMDIDSDLLLPGNLSPIQSPSLHLYNGEMTRLLLEAQRESNNSSALGSRGSSRRGSPKSPPNTPVNESKTNEKENEVETEVVYINPNKDDELVNTVPTRCGYDWSSRPDQQPPKEWKFRHPKKANLSIRNSKAIKSGLSSDAMSLFLFTSFVSFMIGAGLGFYLGKRLTVQLTPVTLD